jgi:branched-chain amino acid transport system substrate-binding protein
MKRFMIIAMAAALMCMGFAGLALAEKTICLGYSLPLTGEHAQYGEVFRNSAKLRLAEFNKSGVIPVKVEHQIRGQQVRP